MCSVAAFRGSSLYSACINGCASVCVYKRKEKIPKNNMQKINIIEEKYARMCVSFPWAAERQIIPGENMTKQK